MLKRCLVVLLAVGSVAIAAQSANLVKNPGLEEAVAGNGLPEHWFFFAKPENAYKAAVVDGGYTGKKALLLEGDGEYSGVAVSNVAMEPGKFYAARGWVKVEGDPAGMATVKLDYFDADNQFLAASAYELQLKPGKTGWHPIALVSRKSDAPTAARVGVTVAISGKAKAWFDDLEMVSRDVAEGPASLLKYGSMEDVAGTLAFGYSLVTNEVGRYEVHSSAADPKEGWHSLHIKGSGEWAVSSEGKHAIDKGKKYVFSGMARAKRGTAQIKIDYFKADEYLGHTVSDDVMVDEWKAVKVVSELEQYAQATHLSAAAVGLGDVDARFDQFVLIAR